MKKSELEILDILHTNNPLRLSELVKRSNLSSKIVTNCVRELLANQVLKFSGQGSALEMTEQAHDLRLAAHRKKAAAYAKDVINCGQKIALQKSWRIMQVGASFTADEIMTHMPSNTRSMRDQINRYIKFLVAAQYVLPVGKASSVNGGSITRYRLFQRTGPLRPIYLEKPEMLYDPNLKGRARFINLNEPLREVA